MVIEQNLGNKFGLEIKDLIVDYLQYFSALS